MQFEDLRTQRLILRKVTQEIRAEIHVLPDETQMKHLGVATQAKLAEEKQKFQKGLSTYNKTFLYFHLLDKETEEIIGWCGYHTWYKDHDRAEIGYGLFQESLKGKGLMTEAIEPIIQYGFDQMNLFRIEAFIGLNNEPSYKILKRFQFVKEGHLRKHYKNEGKLEDSLVYALLKTEYRKS